MNTQNSNRIVWVDLLRLIAMLMVITAHCADMYNAAPQDDPMGGFWGAFIGSFMRPSVPLFAMMTGLLLLPLKGSATDFYRKRIPRVVIPMVVWSVINYMIPWLTGVIGMDKSVISVMFPYVYEPSQELSEAISNISMIPFTFNFYTTHMWYLYMLIGLYFFIPFFSAWVEKGDQKLNKTYLILWGASLMLPYLRILIDALIFGECHWNAYGTLHYFAGFTGYLLLGYLLAKGNPMTTRKIVALGILLYFAGYIITYTGFSTVAEQYTYAEAPELSQLFWQFCSPNVALMAIGVFLIVQRIKINSPKVQAVLASTTKCSFGAYLMHYAIIGPVILVILPLHLPTPLSVLCSAALVFAICWALTALIYKIAPRWAKYIVG
ncbi:MAG: acyltransferase [Alistipes sp.]|nr:acyltransferase [Alistipes sp.]